MPFVHVRSLPVGGGFDADAAVAEVRAALVHDAEIAEEHVVVTWQTADAASGEAAVTVDLHAPDFHPPDRIEAMLRSVAGSVAEVARVSRERVFVSYRPARSGQVLDGGEIVRW